MKLLHAVPKPVFFGLLGGVGCVLGCLAGEPLLSLLKSKSTGEGEQPADHSAVLLFNNEFVVRQKREGAKSGDVQLTLIWNNINDLDLHCIDPNGEHIYFSHKNSAAGGLLDVDMNASPPYSTEPVENIFFPSNGAPLGHYKVLVHHYANHGGHDPTVYSVGVKANGTVREFKGSLSTGDPTNLVYEFDVVPRPATTLIRTAFATKADWKTTIIIGVWTALLALPLSFMLVMGQNSLMRRQLISGQAAVKLFAGGLAAGLVSGAISQYLFSAGAQVLAAGTSKWGWALKGGQVLGWTVLGALLGWGVGIFIPNLPKIRSALAGLAGGLLGAFAFLYATREIGEVQGRLLGSALLGVAIGSIVAIVERFAREAALVVHWDENERTVISLGPTPVVLGSSPEAHVYLPADKGFPDVAATVTFDNGVVELQNLMTEMTHQLHNGNKLQIGSLVIEIQTDSGD